MAIFLTLPFAACGGSGAHHAGGGVPPEAALASLVVSTGAISPTFASTTTDYLDGPARLDPTVTVTATTAVVGAALTIDSVPTASGVASAPILLPMSALTQVDIRVIATDGVTQANYRIVFDRIPIGGRSTYVKPSNTGAGDAFGASMALSGDTMVVGAPSEDSGSSGVGGVQGNESASGSGAAYVFVRSGTTWVQQAYLKASNTGAGDAFGSSVAVSGDTIVVGAPLEDCDALGVRGNPGLEDAGSAYVFVRNGTTWTQQAYLKASNPDLIAEFGTSVAVSGNTIAVGARYESGASSGIDGDQTHSNAGFHSGAVYVFHLGGSVWTQQAYVKASNTDQGADWFGSSVALWVDTLVVGAPAEDSTSTGVNGDQLDNQGAGAGAAYVFVRTGSTWAQEAYLKASRFDTDLLFGSAVAVSGDTILVGAPFEDSASGGIDGDPANQGATDSGAVYVFVRNGTTWSQQAYMKASVPGAGDRFGSSVAVDADLAVVGAPFEDSGSTVVSGNALDNSAPDSGAAYVFVRSGTQWSPGAFVKPPNTGAGDRFGTSVTVWNGSVVVGAAGEASRTTGIGGTFGDNGAPASGAVYAFP